MKSSKYILSLLLLVFVAPYAIASKGFIDKTVNELLQEKITDNRVIVEHQYNSKSKFTKIQSRQDEVQSIVLERFEPKYSSFRVKIQYNDGKADSISGRYASYVMAPVAARYIKFGEIIQDSDVTTQKTRIDSIRKGVATEKSEVVGMQAKKYIAVGRMFMLSEMSSPAVISTNDPVNIIYSSGSISLKTVGTAMGSGAVDDMIKVKNSSTGAILLGQIVNKNTVRVGGDNE